MRGVRDNYELKYLRKALKLFCPDIGLALHRAVEAKMFNKCSLVSPILELGCGDGFFSYVCYGADEFENEEKVSFSGENIRRSMVDERIDIGIDIVANAVRQAKNKSIHKNVMVADISSLPFKNLLFKTIISNSVITHVYDLDKALEEIDRVLHPDGTFMFTVPSEYFGEYLFSTQICKAFGFKSAGPFFVRNYNKKYKQKHLLKLSEWRSRLERVGLRLVESKYYLSRKASFIWSLFFTLSRVGYRRLTLVGLFRKVFAPFKYLFPVLFNKILLNPFENILRGYYEEKTEIGGSIFLIARKID